MYACLEVAMNMADQLQGYFSKYAGMRLAVLFGSRARGDAHCASDVDIGIILDHKPDLIELGGIVASSGELACKKVDLLELEGLPSSNPLLAYRIAVEGHLLFEAEAELWLDYRNRACLQYFDLEEFLTQQRIELGRRLSSGQFGRPVHA
jgi:predicted nucleotidyltransferase